MGIAARILRLWKADIHGVMDQLEDKELLLKQYLREMEHSLQLKESRLQQIAKIDHQVERDILAGKEEIEKLENDLQLALRKEKDDIAKLLIRKQRIQQKHGDHLQRQRRSLKEEQQDLAQLLEEQRLRYGTLKVKAESSYLCPDESRFIDRDEALPGSGYCPLDDENDIELELIRRKEQMNTDGGAV